MQSTVTERGRARVNAVDPSPLLSALRLVTGIGYCSVVQMYFGMGDSPAERKHERRTRPMRVRP
jgi:hypothetical protein